MVTQQHSFIMAYNYSSKHPFGCKSFLCVFEHIDMQAIGVITPMVTYGSVNTVTAAYTISEV